MKLEFLVTMSPSTPRVTQSQEEVASITIAALEKKIAPSGWRNVMLKSPATGAFGVADLLRYMAQKRRA